MQAARSECTHRSYGVEMLCCKHTLHTLAPQPSVKCKRVLALSFQRVASKVDNRAEQPDV